MENDKQETIYYLDPDDMKPGKVINTGHGWVWRIKGVDKDGTAILGPAEPHPELKTYIKCLSRAGATGGTWGMLLLMEADIIKHTYFPKLSDEEQHNIKMSVMPMMMEFVKNRHNAGLPFSGEIPFSVPVPQRSERTVVTRDQNGLITEAEKFLS